MNNLRQQFVSARVLVIGDLMLDEYLLGAAGRISPEAPVPVVDVKQRRYVAGGAGNVAANIRSLGANVQLLGVWGDDGHARLLAGVLAKAQIDTSEVFTSQRRPTTCKTRVIAGQQQIVRFDTETRSPLNADERDILADSFIRALGRCDVCVFSDYGKGVLSAEFCGQQIAAAVKAGKRVIVDPKAADFTKYRGCSLITPNLKEAALAAGFGDDSDGHLFAIGARLLGQLPGASVLITCGADGMALFGPGKAPFSVPAVAREVFDVVGAGDTAVAALAVGLAANLSVELSTCLANVAAGIAVGKSGTVAVSLDELLAHAELRELKKKLPLDAVPDLCAGE
jgi:D-beta-D-heptose 7-phosphate kinase / D-beta-D-heptose 1-phosphate adenosyltransferase